MASLTSQNSFLNLSPKAEFTATGANSATPFVAEDGDAPSFLNALVQALDESNEFLPQDLQVSDEALLQDLALSFQKGSLLGEVEQNALFENLSFMQILSVLENLQIQASEVKLGNLSTQMQQLVQTQSNLDALKGAKNISELLDIAKSLNLKVTNVKIEQIGEFKTHFPNLNKANFFTQNLESVFKEFLNTKISTLIKENESKLTNHSAPKSTKQSQPNLLAKVLQSVSDDDTSVLKSEPKSTTPKLSELLDTADELQSKTSKTPLNNDETQISAPKPAKVELASNKGLENVAKATFSEPSAALKDEKPLLNEQPKSTPAKEKLASETKQTPANALDSKPQSEPKTFASVLTQSTQSLKSVANQAPQENSLKENKDNKESKIAPKESKETKSELSQKFVLNDEKPVIKDEKIVQSTLKSNEPQTQKAQSPQIQPITPKTQPKAQNSVESKGTTSKESFEKSLQSELSKENLSTNATNTSVESKNPTNLESLMSKLQSKLNADTTSTASVQTLSERQSEQVAKADEIDFGISSDDNSELNAALKDLSQVSRSELKSDLNLKETFRNFAQDFKEQMQTYKPPITRFNITLNPSNLGEVEVTLVQRGQNLHISFNTNTSTMNLFIQNQAEFKNSLVNMGFTGLEMNFSDQSKKDRQQQGKNRSGYGFKEEFENINPQNTALEFVLAKYF
mgnify:FL=1